LLCLFAILIHFVIFKLFYTELQRFKSLGFAKVDSLMPRRSALQMQPHLHMHGHVCSDSCSWTAMDLSSGFFPASCRRWNFLYCWFSWRFPEFDIACCISAYIIKSKILSKILSNKILSIPWDTPMSLNNILEI